MAPSSHAARRNSWPFFLFGKRKRKGVPVHVHDTKLGTDLLSPTGPGSGIENPTAVFLCQRDGKPHTVDNEIALLPPPPPPPQRRASEGTEGTSTSAILKPQAKQLQTKLATTTAKGHPLQSVDSVFCTIRPPKAPATAVQPRDGTAAVVQPFGGGGGGGGKSGGGYVNGQMLQFLGEAPTSDGERSSSLRARQEEEQRRQQRQPSNSSNRPRSWAGVVAPQPLLSMSGRQPIAPRHSLGSAAKHAQPPPSPPLPTGKRRTVGGRSLDGGGAGRNGGHKSGRKKVVIIKADMEEDLQNDAVDCATRAMDEFNADTDIAAFIKKDFDKKHGSKWHCIVGRHFGSFVTHDAKHFIYLYRGQVAVLLFKAAGSTAPLRPGPPRPTPPPRSVA